MINISLSEIEHSRMIKWLEEEIARFKKSTALDPFEVAEVVNFYHKVKESINKPLVPSRLEVLPNIPVHPTITRMSPQETDGTHNTVTADNIDDFQSKLIEKDSLEEKIAITSPSKPKITP